MITQGTVVVGTVATLIHRSTSNGCSVHIYSANGGQDVTLGNGCRGGQWVSHAEFKNLGGNVRHSAR